MTRRRFYAPPQAFTDEKNSVTLAAEEARHARNVLRLHRGDDVYVFDGEGGEYLCAIDELTQTSARLTVVELVEAASPESPLTLTLAVALLKGEKFDLVIQKATELGVTSILPLITKRADVRIHDADEARKKVARWQRIALEATKQCGRARRLKVGQPVSLESLVATPGNDGQLRLMFAERGGTSFAEAVSNLSFAPTQLTAIVGPEGGFADEEIAESRAAGWNIVTMGGRIMRAETAAIAIAALLQHNWGDLR